MAPTATRLIGIGNPYRQDDGVGLWVVHRLQAQQLQGVEVFEASGEMGALLESWRGARRVYLIDALAPAGQPGRIQRLDAHQQELPQGLFRCSTHSFGLAEAVELARALGQLPEELIIFGIEGREFGDGEKLSAAVEEAAQELVRRLTTELQG